MRDATMFAALLLFLTVTVCLDARLAGLEHKGDAADAARVAHTLVQKGGCECELECACGAARGCYDVRLEIPAAPGIKAATQAAADLPKIAAKPPREQVIWPSFARSR